MHKPVLLCCQKQSNYMMQSFSFGHGSGPSVLNVDPETHILIRNLRESTAHNTDHPQKKNRHIIQSIIFMKNMFITMAIDKTNINMIMNRRCKHNIPVVI